MSRPDAQQFATELIIVRRFLTQGTEAVARADDISIRSGLILVDLAAETLLKTVLRALGKRIHPKSDFYALMSAVQGAPEDGTANLGFVSGLSALRNTRNCVVHDGTGQDAQVARQLVGSAGGLLARLVRDVWNMDLFNLRINDFLQEERTQYLFSEAEKRLKQKLYPQAAGVARALFEHLVRKWTAFNQAVFDLREAPTDKFAQIVATLSAGVYLPDLQRFRRVTRRVPTSVTVTGDISTMIDGGWGTTSSQDEQEKAARFALDFAAGFALQVEERIGSTTPEPSKLF